MNASGISGWVRYRFGLLGLTLLLTGCAYSTPQTGSENLPHFGFVGVDCGWDDSRDRESRTTYLDEVAPFSNVAQLCPFSLTEDLGPRLTQFHAVGVKAIITLEGLLFESLPDPGSPTGERLVLSAEAEANWRTFAKLNRDWLTPNYVAALYIVDEPMWRGASAADFAQAVAIIEEAVPDVPTMSVEAYAALDRLVVPDALDWLGFDRFGHADPAHDQLWLDDLETLRAARTRSDQRLVIVADTQWYPEYESVLGLSSAAMAGVFESYAEVGRRDPDIALLIGYSWPGGLDGPEQRGARELPENVQRAFSTYGALVRGQ